MLSPSTTCDHEYLKTKFVVRYFRDDLEYTWTTFPLPYILILIKSCSIKSITRDERLQWVHVIVL